MSSKQEEKHVTFLEGSRESVPERHGLGPVGDVVETTKEALAQATENVMSYIPGTAEYTLRKSAQEAEEAEKKLHTADDLAYTQGPAAPAPSHAAPPPKDLRTVDDVDFTSGKFTKPSPDPGLHNPKDPNHTADDVAFLQGGEGQQPPSERRAIDPHTADDIAYGKANEGAMSSAEEVLQASKGPADKLHTADDLAYEK